MKLTPKEASELRKILRHSIGEHADKLTEEELVEFGSLLLSVTSTILKAKYAKRIK